MYELSNNICLFLQCSLDLRFLDSGYEASYPEWVSSHLIHVRPGSGVELLLRTDVRLNVMCRTFIASNVLPWQSIDNIVTHWFPYQKNIVPRKIRTYVNTLSPFPEKCTTHRHGGWRLQMSVYHWGDSGGGFWLTRTFETKLQVAPTYQLRWVQHEMR